MSEGLFSLDLHLRVLSFSDVFTSEGLSVFTYGPWPFERNPEISTTLYLPLSLLLPYRSSEITRKRLTSQKNPKQSTSFQGWHTLCIHLKAGLYVVNDNDYHLYIYSCSSLHWHGYCQSCAFHAHWHTLKGWHESCIMQRVCQVALPDHMQFSCHKWGIQGRKCDWMVMCLTKANKSCQKTGIVGIFIA